MATEHVRVRMSFLDQITRPLRRVERQADDTRDALNDMDDGTLARNLRRTDKEARSLHGTLGRLAGSATGFDTIVRNIKIPAFLTAARLATTAISALSAATVALIGAAGPIVGVYAVIPNAMAAIMGARGVLMFATSGIGEAVKVLTSADATAQEVNAALRDLSPAAQGFVRHFADLHDRMKDVRRTAQENLFPGLHTALKNLEPLIEPVSRYIEQVSFVIGGLAENASRLMGSGPFARDFSRILDTNAWILRFMGEAAIGLVDVFRHLAVASGPMVEAFFASTAGAMKNLASFLALKRETGELQEFFETALRVATGFKNVIRDVAFALYNIMSIGADWGGEMGRGIEDAAAQFRAWTESDSGIQSITRWFEEARPVVSAFGDVFKKLFSVLGAFSDDDDGLVKTLQAISKEGGLLDHIQAIAMGFDDTLGPTLVNLGTTVVRFFNLLSFQPLIDLATVFATLADKVLSFIEGLSGEGKNVLAFSLAVGKIPLALAAIGKVTGIASIAKLLSQGSAVRRFTQGLKGAEGAADTLAGKMGGKLATAAKSTGTAIKTAALALSGWVVTGVRAAANMTRQAALWLVMKTRLIAYKVASFAVQAATKAWTAAQWLLNIALNANPIGLVVAAIGLLVGAFILAWNRSETFRNIVKGVFEAVVNAGRSVANWFTETLPNAVSDATDWVRDKWNGIVDFVKALPDRIGRAARGMWNGIKTAFKTAVNAIIRFWNSIEFSIPGFKVGPVSFGGFTLGVPDIPLMGDTKRSRAAGSGLARTLATHAMVEAMTPGSRRITNIFRGGHPNSDHLGGSALDLKGAFMNTYMRNLRALGGWAEHHGSGGGRHLHGVYGDTARSRVGAPRVAASVVGSGGTHVEINAPLIGQVVASRDVDVERAVSRGLERWLEERERRR